MQWSFFLIVTGYLMAASIHKETQVAADKIPAATGGFLKKKLAGFLPEFIISWIIAFTVCVSADGLVFSEIADSFKRAVNELFFVKMIATNGYSVNGATWYLAAMIIGIIILYPLARYRNGTLAKYLVPIIVVIAGGVLIQNDPLPDNFAWLGIFYSGTIRALLGMGIGMMAYYIFEKLSHLKLKTTAKVLIEIFETAVYVGVFVAMVNVENSKEYFLLSLFLAVAVAFTFSGQGINHIFDNRICYFLGKLSLPLYLSNYFYAHKMEKLFPQVTDKTEQYLLLWLLSLATAFFVMFAGMLFRKYKSNIYKGLKNIMVYEK